MDSASRQMGAGVSLQLKAPTGERVEQAIRLDFPTSNKLLILARINLARSVSSKKLLIRSDSQLVVGQVNEEYETLDQRKARYVGLVKQQLESFAAWKIEHMLRDSNERVDALVTVAASIPIKETLFLPIYYQPASSIATDQVSQIDETCPS